MAIYERGYRPYEGSFRSMPGWWIVAREGWSLAAKHRGVRALGLLVLLLAAGSCVILFVRIGLQPLLERGGAQKDFSQLSAELLVESQWTFYEFSTLVSVFCAVMIGCGLIADDMRSRALTLYLVRPISRFSYVFGKALILPGLFFVLCLVPGLVVWFLVGSWPVPHSLAGHQSTASSGSPPRAHIGYPPSASPW